MDTLSWGTKTPPLSSEGDRTPLVSSGACFDKASSEIHSGM
jgi:hypothetical protein